MARKIKTPNRKKKMNVNVKNAGIVHNDRIFVDGYAVFSATGVTGMIMEIGKSAEYMDGYRAACKVFLSMIDEVSIQNGLEPEAR